MKKDVLFFAFMLFFCKVFSQSPATTTVLTNEALLKESKNQRTTAIILTTAGFLATGAGIGMYVANGDTSEGTGAGGKKTAGTILAVTGFAAMIASIPLYISASKNKKKAYGTTLSFKNETAPTFSNGVFYNQLLPSLCIRFGL